MADLTRYVLDSAALASAITTIARHRKISMNQVARETGLSPSTLTRLSQGHKLDADGLLTVLMWLGDDAWPFARERENGQARALLEEVARG